MPASLTALFPPTRTPRTSATKGRAHARTEKFRPGVTAEQVGAALLEAGKSDLHALAKPWRLVLATDGPVHKRIHPAARRSRVIADILAAGGDGFTRASLDREAELFGRQAAALQAVLPDLANRLPEPDPNLRLALIAAHRVLVDALDPACQALARDRRRQADWKRRGHIVTDEERFAIREKIATDPKLWQVARGGTYHVDETIRPATAKTSYGQRKPRTAPPLPIVYGNPYAADVSDLLPQKLTDAEVEARFDLATWLQHGTCDLTRTRLDPPSNLFPLARLISHVDPAHPMALDVVAAVLHCAHDRDDERDQPGFKFAIEGMMLSFAWGHPEFRHITNLSERAAALTRCWEAELARPVAPDAVARLTAWRRARTAMASNQFSLARIGEANARLARMRTWLSRATRDASARAALAMAGMIDAV